MVSNQFRLQQPYFSPRQMVTAYDLNAGMTYLADRMRRHNRYLHGCGIVCGMQLEVDIDADTKNMRLAITFDVSSGTAISPQGEFISVPSLKKSFNDVRIPNNESASRQSLWEWSRGEQRPSLYLLVRYANAPNPNYLQSGFPDDCHKTTMISTRISEGYTFDLSTVLPTSCSSSALSACGDVLNELLHHDAVTGGDKLADMMSCSQSTSDECWLVVGTINIEMVDDYTFESQISYQDRSLLPSARMLLELLACLPEIPHIETAAITAYGVSRWFSVKIKGYGFTPFLRVEIDDPRIHTMLGTIWDLPTQERSIEFWMFVPAGVQLVQRSFRIVTEFDTIDSAACKVYLNVPPRNTVAYYYGYGSYAARAIGERLL